MKEVSARGVTYTGTTWAEVLAAALRGAGAGRTDKYERETAKNALRRGVSVTIGGILITPKGARE